MPNSYTLTVTDNTTGEQIFDRVCQSYALGYVDAEGIGLTGYTTTEEVLKVYALIKARLVERMGVNTMHDFDMHLHNNMWVAKSE